MSNERELQTEINSSEAKLAELTGEAAALDKARFTVGVDAEKVKDLDRKLFEARQRVMEKKIALLDAEKAPLLDRVRAAQAATKVARAAYDEALKALRTAEQVEHDVAVPLSTNAFARVALTEEMEQQTLERSLELKALATGKPAMALMGAHLRPSRWQPAFEAPRR